ncbi:MAG: hypothetical protein CL609_06990 [Anaerolineaceae bacterium]|nr:hypothetical protein [Anaerolineaceae bacterium]
MITSKYGFQNKTQLLSLVLMASLLVTMLAACSPPLETGLPEPSFGPPSFAEPTLTPIPTLPPFDETSVVFEEERHTRTEFCARTFDMHKTSYGALTISIADNLVEPQDTKQLAVGVEKRYTELSIRFPEFMQHPVTVFILSNPAVGECYSRYQYVFVDPDELDSRKILEDLLGAGSGTSEYWVRSGLASLVLGEEPDQAVLQTWYETTDDLDMTGLFYARFLEDWATEEELEIARMSAASLVRYAMEVESISPDKFVEQVNNNVRTRWLASLGVDREVTYPYDGRFTGFVYSQRSDCSLLVQTLNIQYCLNRMVDQEYFDELSEAEFLIDHVYYGRKALVEYLLAEAPSIDHLIDPEEKIIIEVKETSRFLGNTSGNIITIQRSAVYYYVLHEIVHTFNWGDIWEFNTLWLNEGFAEYLGKLLPIYQQTAKRCIYQDFNRFFHDEEMNTDPTISSWYFLDAEQFESAQLWYRANGGEMDNEESINPRLYTDAVAFATMYRDAHGGSRRIPIGLKYSVLSPNNNLEGQKGLELSYTQAAAFIGWLCDTYTLDRVLDVYVNNAEGGKLDGKSYEELKTDWQDYLISRGEGITIPGQP